MYLLWCAKPSGISVLICQLKDYSHICSYHLLHLKYLLSVRNQSVKSFKVLSRLLVQSYWRHFFMTHAHFFSFACLSQDTDYLTLQKSATEWWHNLSLGRSLPTNWHLCVTFKLRKEKKSLPHWSEVIQLNFYLFIYFCHCGVF